MAWCGLKNTPSPFFQGLSHYTAVKKIIHPLLLLIAKATEKEATKYIEYLKAENRILRSKLPKRIEVTEAERATLVKLGKRVGAAIKDLVSAPSRRAVCRFFCDSTGE